MRNGGCCLRRVDGPHVLVCSDVHVHSAMLLGVLPRLMHLGTFNSFVTGKLDPRSSQGRAGTCIQGCIADRLLLHGHAVSLEVFFHWLKDLCSQIMHPLRVPERRDCGLLRNLVTHLVDATEPA